MKSKTCKHIYNFIRFLTIFIFASMLASCSNNTSYPADSFNGKRFSLSSFGFDTFTDPNSGEVVAKWKQQNYVTNGSTILILVDNTSDSRWAPFSSETNRSYGTLPSELLNDKNGTHRCKIRSPYVANDLSALITNSSQVNSKGELISCYFDKGIGLYVLFVNPDEDFDPNANIDVANNPKKYGGIVRHLGNWRAFSPNDYSEILNTLKNLYGEDQIENRTLYNLPTPYDQMGGLYVVNPSSMNIQNGAKVYFKFQGSNYGRHVGAYNISMRSGFNQTIFNGFFEIILAEVTKGIIKPGIQIFKNLVAPDNLFATIVRSVLSLYIVTFSLFYLMGMIQSPQGDFLMRILKLGIILTLISPGSYDFFSSVLFDPFLTLSTDIISTFFGGSGSGSSKFGVLDAYFNVFLTDVFWIKILAIVLDGLVFGTVPVLGLVFAGIFLIVIGFLTFKFLITIVKAGIMYILSLVIIALLIAVSPLFLLFMLFQNTSYLMQNWVRQFAVYTFQPIMVFAGLAFALFFFWGYTQQLLGFTVAPKPSIFFGVNVLAPSISEQIETILVPNRFDRDGATCEPYTCVERRYIDIPFYRPASCVLSSNASRHSDLDNNCRKLIGIERNAINEQEYINQIVGLYGNSPAALRMPFHLPTLFYMWFFCYLIFSLMEFLPVLGSGIAGQQFSFAQSGTGNLWQIATGAMQAPKNFLLQADNVLGVAFSTYRDWSQYAKRMYGNVFEFRGVKEEIARLYKMPLDTIKNRSDQLREKVSAYDNLMKKVETGVRSTGAYDAFQEASELYNKYSPSRRATRGGLHRAIEGQKLVTKYELGKTLADHYAYKLTLGMAGENMYENHEMYGERGKLGKLTTAYALANNLSADQEKDLYVEMVNRSNEKIPTNGTILTGMAIGAVNPTLAVIPLAKFGYDYYKKFKDADTVDR